MRSANVVRAVEAAVAVGVHEPDDAVRALLELHIRFLVRAGAVGDVEPSLLVKVRADRPLNERRSGDRHDLNSAGTFRPPALGAASSAAKPRGNPRENTAPRQKAQAAAAVPGETGRWVRVRYSMVPSR
jgi:hypothetical protein